MTAIFKLQELIILHGNDVRKEDHMVYQVWNDGEVTLQKGGDLLWQRTLHQQASGIIPGKIQLAVDWPHKTVVGYGYIFTDREGAYAVREAIHEAYKEYIATIV